MKQPIRSTPGRADGAGRSAEQVRALNAIRGLVGTLFHSARGVEKRTGLTNAQLMILRQVAAGPLTVSEIAARVHAGQSAVSIVLGRLARAKLVRRHTTAEDRRRVIIELTASGRKVLRRSPRAATEMLLAALDRLPARDAKAIADGLGALLLAMGVEAGSAPLLFEAGPRRRP